MKKALIIVMSILLFLGIAIIIYISIPKDNPDDTSLKTSVTYEQAKLNGFNGTYEIWESCLNGTETLSPYELVKNYNYQGSLNDWLNLLKQNETKEIQITIVDNFIMWRFVETNTWYKLISLSYLKNGSSEIEISTTPLHIVYKTNGEWNKLIEIETLNKPKNKHLGMISYELALDLNYQKTVKEWFETLNERINFEWIKDETYIKWKTIESTSWSILFDITTIYPKPNIYVVTFFDINGVVLSRQEIEDGAYLNEVPLYELEGYKINGWLYKNEIINEIPYLVKENMDLYPSLEEEIYNITYELYEGMMIGEEIKTFKISDSIELPQAVVPGREFDGWYLESTFETKVKKTSNLPLQNVTLHAKFITLLDDYPDYYHVGMTSILKDINIYNVNYRTLETDIMKAFKYSHNGFWEKKMNNTKDGYEWVGANAKELPRLINPAEDSFGNDLNVGTIFEFEIKVYEELKYSTLSNITEHNKYNGKEVEPDDYLTVLKHIYNQHNGLKFNKDLIEGDYTIKGLKEYYNSTKEELSPQELEQLWDEVGYDIINREGKWYIQVEFNEQCNTYNAMETLLSNMYTPLPETFLLLIGGIQNYGKPITDLNLTPIDTSLSTGYYVLKEMTEDNKIIYVKNQFIDTGERYKFPGVVINMFEYVIGTASDASLYEFLNGHLDSSSIPINRVDSVYNYKDLTKALVNMTTQNIQLHVNSCTQETWEELFGENGSVVKTNKNNYWECEPIMSNDNFLKGLSYCIDRVTLAQSANAVPTGNYFADIVTFDPMSGISFNRTWEHKYASDAVLENTDGYGYNIELAMKYFKAACEDLISAGIYKANQTINIEIASMTSAQLNVEGIMVAQMIEKAFNNCKGKLKIKVSLWVGNIWTDVFYNKLFCGQYDLAFGNLGDPDNYLDSFNFLRSDNPTGMTLNWGKNTNEVSDQLFFDETYWSYNALCEAVTKGAYIKDGVLNGNLFDVVILEQNVNPDKSVTVKFKWGAVDDPQLKASISKIVVANYEEYYTNYNYTEYEIEFSENNNIITIEIPKEINELIDGYIGYDIYIDTDICGMQSEEMISLAQTTNPSKSDIYIQYGVNEINPLAEPNIGKGGKIYSYVNASYEIHTKIAGLLERYLVMNHLTGITLYGNGNYILYSKRIIPGTGSWDNYIPGYGFGVFEEGYADGYLQPIEKIK